MSKDTTKIKDYIESFSHLNQNPFPISHREKIEIGRPHLFDFTYPLFDEGYRKEFETHFIRNFYMQEIGSETFALFKFRLETWLEINMDYFNKLFESELLNFDPLKNSEMSVTHTKKKDTDQSQNSKTDGTSDSTTKQNSASEQSGTGNTIDDNFERVLDSDNPQNRLALTAKDGESVIEYASTIKENNENNKKTSTSSTHDSGETTATGKDKTTMINDTTGNVNETEDFIQKTIGKTGSQSYSKLLQEYRSSFMRIEKTIFEEMQELFMLVF